MSKFTCDICGGIIKMQANRTGVCQGCGMEYDIEAIKAMASADKTVSSNSESTNISTSINNSTNNEIDRKALLIYLNDVRTLESIISQSNEKIISLNNKIDSYTDKYESLKAKRSLMFDPEKPDVPEMEPTDSGTIVAMIIGTIICIIVGVFLTTHNLGILGIPLILIMIIGCILVIAEKSSEPQKKYNEAMYEYDKALEKFNKAVQEFKKINTEISNAEKNIENKKSEVQPITKSLNDDIDDTKAVLDKAYSANIIPIPFRNIEGVYYLYDYISSSNQSLSEALMQANLDAIKNKMDQVIKLQAVGIIQQAQTNAKLDSIQNQNKQIISAAERTAANSELTAQYSAITAINSEITKRILKRELAYQRADFWLK